MAFSPEQTDTLHGLYISHVARLKSDVIEVNRSLGSSHPEKTGIEPLSREDFSQRVKSGIAEGSEAVQLWIKRILHGHEQEHPDLVTAVDSIEIKK